MNTCPCFVKNPRKSNFTIIPTKLKLYPLQTFSLFRFRCLKSITEESTPLNILISSDFLSRQSHFFQKFITQFIYSFVWLESMWSNIGFGLGSIKCTPNLSPPQRESACSVNRTNPSPLHSRYIFIYIQKEFWQEGGERKKSIQRHKRQKSPFVSIMEGENLLILYSLWTKDNFDFFCPFKRYINDGSM